MNSEGKSGTEFWSSFRALREAVSNTPEGKGGIAALSGFSFQFLVSLEAMVATSATDKAAIVFLETLSDLAVVRDDQIEVTQIKLTLSSPAASRGIEELWRVDNLARSMTPELVPSLRYKLLGSRSEISDIESKLRKWVPPGAFEADVLEEFRRKLSSEIKSNPRLSLATSLVNLFSVSEPFELIDRWIGKLFSVGYHEELFERAREISIALAGLDARRRQIGAEFRLWSRHDRPPAGVVREVAPAKAVLTGQTPHRDDLRAGRFAPRSIYSDIATTAENWLAPSRGPNRELMSAFWISGRSGTGKSVALLHLLSGLHEEDPSRVIVWLGNHSARIGDAVQWCRPFVSEGLQVILAADDPYTSAQQTQLSSALTKAKAEIESFAELYSAAPRPVMILCGPTEQADAFEYDFSDDVRVQHYLLPHETDKDLEELRAWYVQRTGRTTLPIERDGHLLIVQLFFEWSTGEKIASFGGRFQTRLKDLAHGQVRGPFEIVADILALNRLYALYPAEALKAELRNSPILEAAFKQLTEDRHFSFIPQWGGYKLIHPHLADAIYRTWFGSARDSGFRKSHLRQGIRAALEFGENPSEWFAPLWAISRLTSPTAMRVPEIVDRIELIKDDLRQVLVETYEELFSKTELPLVDLPVWVNLDAAFELDLLPSPLELIVKAVKEAPYDAPGFRLACHIILNHGDTKKDGAHAVRDVLREYPDWWEWPKVALHYIRRHGLSELMPTLVRFVEQHPMQARQLANAILHGNELDFQIHGREVIGRWFSRNGAYLGFQAGFLTDFIDRWGCDQHAFDTGLNFLCRFPSHPSWSHVWERLRTDIPEDAARHANLGREWLTQSDGAITGWARVWEQLWEEQPGDAQLRRIALNWLGAQPADGSWRYVWQDLWEAEPENAELWQCALHWLDSQTRGSWNLVWHRLWKAQPGHPELRRVALAWLEGPTSEAEDWTDTWQAIWESLPGDARMRRLGLEWLETTATTHGGWPRIWRTIWDDASDEQLRQLGLGWLDKVPAEHTGWARVWIPLRKAMPGDARLRRAGLNWLEKAPAKHPKWTLLWTLLWLDAPGNDEVLSRGRHWLSLSAAHYFWPVVWKYLWDYSGAADEMTALGLDWLCEPSRRAKSWAHVWLPLAASGLVDPGTLYRIAQRLLVSANPKQFKDVEAWLARHGFVT